jgi:hypothetical protein
MARHNKQMNSWREEYPVHPCADVFPMMADPELRKLAEDIKVHGLAHPPVLWEDPKDKDKLWLLDGRNRLEALAILERQGQPWEGSPIIDVHVKDPASYIISANIRRRHLTKAQQAELIVKTIRAGNTHNPKSGLRVSRNGRGQIKRLKDPDLEQAVTTGKRHGISRSTIYNANAKAQEKASKKKIGLSKRRPKNEALPLGMKHVAQASTVQWQRDVQLAIRHARQVVSVNELLTYIHGVLEQESIAS